MPIPHLAHPHFLPLLLLFSRSSPSAAGSTQPTVTEQEEKGPLHNFAGSCELKDMHSGSTISVSDRERLCPGRGFNSLVDSQVCTLEDCLVGSQVHFRGVS